MLLHINKLWDGGIFQEADYNYINEGQKVKFL